MWVYAYECQCPLRPEAYDLSGTEIKGQLSDRGTGT